MQPTPPPRLYKYQPFSARTLTSLKSRELWFGAPSGLNDPFDCAVPYRLGAVTLDDCERYLAHKPELAEQVRGAVGYLDAAGRPTQALRQAIENGARKAFEEQVSRSASRGVACFSEIADSTLLWSHYGGGHRGICLEFDTSSTWLSKLHPVRYCEDIPEVNAIETLLSSEPDALWVYLTKASCWSYEREWRAIHGKAGTAYCYGIGALMGVYLGAALSASERDLVAHVLHGTPVTLYDVSRSSSSFSLETRVVEYTPYRHDAV
jgi:hypothetical protein